MSDIKKIEWVLRIAVAGEFFGHGVFALQGKEAWIGWIARLIGVGDGPAGQVLFLIGLMDLAIALIVLVRPISWLLLWAAFWGFWTALVRPIVGEPVWDFVERWANWGAPLALFFLLKKEKDIR
ncbi:hypothetical protein C4587_02300 [Candidatus Parcubacteria bacterium]|nr:MAG: hypothetical protein C4587_02300 [Candidatus Parcubacteria bacterium]